MTKTFYVARDRIGYLHDGVCFSLEPPQEKQYHFCRFYPDSDFGDVGYDDFLKITSIKLKPGQIKKLKIVEAK